MGKTPFEQSIIVMAMMAAELWTHIVRMLPMIKNTKVVTKLSGSKEEKKSRTGWLCAKSMSMPACRSVPKPRNMKETPKMKSPMILRFLE